MVESAVPADVIELYRDVTSYNSEFNHNASDKMKLLGLGEIPPPAQCFVCGSGTCEAGYVTFGYWVDFIGNLLICTPCLVQAAECISCAAPVVRELLENHVKELQAYSKDLEQKLVIQDEQLAAYRTLLHDASVASGLVDDPAPEDEFATPTLFGEDVTSEPAAEPELTEPSDESGPDDLHDVTESNAVPLIKL